MNANNISDDNNDINSSQSKNNQIGGFEVKFRESGFGNDKKLFICKQNQMKKFMI